ncbi:MAG: DNA starvation/stationary phase protection protein Dps [Vampirovibrionales bacterium]|nr:DNA starvation/stationary phase protection protein Dps [Vampirovibrionales bacterium]
MPATLQANLPALHATRIDISKAERQVLIGELNIALALMTDLVSQVKFSHWNVKGPNFIALHELFDTFAADLTAHIDAIAERATALGGTALGTVRMASEHSTLPEFPVDVFTGPEVVTVLAERYAEAAKLIRAKIDAAEQQNDKDTADLFTGVSRDLDKQLWLLEAHLQG